jgi:hypothetical protein
MTHCVLDDSCRTGGSRNGDDVTGETKPVVATTRIGHIHRANTKHEKNRIHMFRMKRKIPNNAENGPVSLDHP